MTTPSICPKCGVTIPDGAPQGLCPKCVLLGAATEIQSVARLSKAAAPPTVAELAVHFPELEILEMIGAGGMGAVYKARQAKLDRLVALKVLSSDLAGDPAFAERFDREARLLARLNHPNIVTVFDSSVAGPFAYLMMEFVDGVNLRQAMKAGRFTPPEALALVQDICAALKFAHEQGILHRDIKPENILIDSRGQVKIADFGIAKLSGEEGQDLLTLTHRGFALGSPHYMAPEQFESPGDVDQRADIYSLGVVLYELLTGELPLGRFAPPSKKSAVDARIDEIVMRTLERERELRFQTVEQVKTEVQAATGSGSRQGATPPPNTTPPVSSPSQPLRLRDFQQKLSLKTHLPILAVFQIGVGAFSLISSLVAIPVLFGVFSFGRELHRDFTSLHAIPLSIGSSFVVIRIFSMLFYSLPGIIGGWGLFYGKKWARLLLLVLGFLQLLQFPFGTMLGIYTLLVLFRDPEPPELPKPVASEK